MSLRHIALYIVVAGLAIYAWKDWFKSLCGLILLTAVIEHASMPKSIMGIQGLNPWNVLFGIIFLAWLAARRREGLSWDMPRHINIMLLLYLGIIFIGFVRLVLDRSHINVPLKSLISDELINTIKWALPGVLLFDGCRTRRRLIAAIVCLLVMYLGVAVMVIKYLPIEAAYRYSDAVHRTRLKLDRTIGYHSCDISPFLAGAFWALVACSQLLKKRLWRFLSLLPAGIIALGQALSGGRAGYVAWAGTGFIMCALKWRKTLLLAPVILMLFPVLLPGPTERMLQGFGQTDVAGQETIDTKSVTSGRLLIWPYVIEKIGESPVVGYGRLAMKRTGLADWLWTNLRQSFPHAHNMYLDCLLDNGILGSLLIFMFWAVVLVHAARLFRNHDRLCSAVGGLTLALMVSQLIAGLGSQFVYPRASTLGMWAAIFLMLRVHVEQRYTASANVAFENQQVENLLQLQETSERPAYSSI